MYLRHVYFSHSRQIALEEIEMYEYIRGINLQVARYLLASSVKFLKGEDAIITLLIFGARDVQI